MSYINEKLYVKTRYYNSFAQKNEKYMRKQTIMKAIF